MAPQAKVFRWLGGRWEQRELQVKGREEPVRAWSLRPQAAALA
jgi:hypothetical protein